MNQFVILSFGVDPLNWPSFIEIGEIACSTPAWCTHGLTLKFLVFSFLSYVIVTLTSNSKDRVKNFILNNSKQIQ